MLLVGGGHAEQGAQLAALLLSALLHVYITLHDHQASLQCFMMRECVLFADTTPGSTTASNLVTVAIAKQQLQLFRSIPEVTSKIVQSSMCV
jgi:hypothetical protein